MRCGGVLELRRAVRPAGECSGWTAPKKLSAGGGKRTGGAGGVRAGEGAPEGPRDGVLGVCATV